MATKEASPTDYEPMLGELAHAIRKRRPDCPPRETARLLLEYENPGQTALVGIYHDADQAILFQERDQYVIGVDYGPDGLAEGGPVLADFEEFGSNIYSFVRGFPPHWAWLNPRFR